MTWDDLLFAHWKVDANLVREQLPKELELDTFNGDAYVGIVPFVMSEIRLKSIPKISKLSFPEINLRTYVKVNNKPGVYFFNLDAESILGVALAKFMFHIPYYYAKFSIQKNDESIEYKHQRKNGSASFIGTYKPIGEPFFAARNSLEYWLTERYRFYSVTNKGVVVLGEIAHEPWTLQVASLDIQKSSLFEASSFEHPADLPHLLYSKSIRVSAAMLSKMTSAASDLR
jgi:uncharacterized protein YqjF (DUF2071 family)